MQDEHPDTVFTVITGEGRFFSSGADVKNEANRKRQTYDHIGQAKVAALAHLAYMFELLRLLCELDTYCGRL